MAVTAEKIPATGSRLRLRIVQKWGRYKPGDIITPWAGGLRTSLIKKGIAEPVEDDAYETATARPVAERAIAPPGRKRGRPKGSKNKK
jgi:hypothetical protein